MSIPINTDSLTRVIARRIEEINNSAQPEIQLVQYIGMVAQQYERPVREFLEKIESVKKKEDKQNVDAHTVYSTMEDLLKSVMERLVH